MKVGGGAGDRGRLALLLVVPVLALFFLPALSGPDQFLARDAGSLHHPMKEWVASRWAAGRLPEWNPLSGLGIPEVAGAVDAVLHPFNVLLVALPFEAGFKAWVLLSYLAAALGGFAWARALGCTRAAALLGGLCFALSGHLVGSSDNLQYLTSLAFLPWIFALARRFQSTGAAGALAGTGLASLVVAAGGDPQAWGLAILLLAPCLLAAGTPAGDPRRPGRAMAAVAVATLAAAPAILPVVLWLPHSSRAIPVDAARLAHWDLLPRRLLELLVPNLVRSAPGTMVSPAWDAFTEGGRSGLPWVASIYLGISTLLLAGAGAVRSRAARWLVLSSAVLTWMACGRHLGFAQLASGIPVLGSFRYWEKLFAWPALFLAMAAALGVDGLLRSGAPALRRFALASALVAGVLLAARVGVGASREALLSRLAGGDPARVAGAVELLSNATDGLVSSGLAAALLALAAAASALPRLGRLAPALLVIAAVADPFSANGHAYALADPATVTGRAPLADWARARGRLVRVFGPYEITSGRWPDRTELESGWAWGSRTLRAAWNVRYGVGNLDPYAGMLPARLSELRMTLRAADLARSAGTFGVEAVVVPGSPALVERLELPPPTTILAEDAELPAYLVALRSRPRAYLADGILPVEPGRAREPTLALDPATRDVVVEGPVPPGLAGAPGSVRVERDAPERVTLLVDSDRPALLVLSDQAAPGWSATIDGLPAPTLVVNHLVRGVRVDGGRHAVEFRYRTPGLVPGFLVAAATLASIGGWAAFRRRRRGPPAGPEPCTE